MSLALLGRALVDFSVIYYGFSNFETYKRSSFSVFSVTFFSKTNFQERKASSLNLILRHKKRKVFSSLNVLVFNWVLEMLKQRSALPSTVCAVVTSLSVINLWD